MEAGPVSPSRAEAVARQYLKAETGRTPTLRQLETPNVLTKSIAAEPAYYIFEAREGGFVIIAGDDRLSPVIGWSQSGSFDTSDIPPQVEAWLAMWRDISDAMRSGRLKAVSEAAEQWDSIEKGRYPSYSTIKTLETAKWGQDLPFNMFCRDDCPAGCVAVATAIIMRYHEWPEKGIGELPAYDYVDSERVRQHEDAIPLGHEYNWDKMPLEIGTSTSSAEMEEIARLIHETGVMVQSSYDKEGTGAYSQDVYKGLVDYYSYDAGAFLYERCYYSDSEWTRALTENIDNVGPVLYSGYSEEGGHAFVIDGYNSEGQFRINFGWEGRFNGFYTFPAFDEFTQGHCALLNIKKDEGGPLAECLIIDGMGREQGLSSNVTDFRIGEEFDVSCHYLFNISTSDFDGEIALAVMHRDGSMGEIVAVDSLYIEANSGYALLYEECFLEEEIFIGDRLCMWFRSGNTPEWAYIPANLEDGNCGGIPIADASTLEEVTSFRYVSASGILTFTTKKDISWMIADRQGNEYSQGVTYEDDVLIIDTNLFKLDSYIITLTKNNDSKSVEFVFGKQ